MRSLADRRGEHTAETCYSGTSMSMDTEVIRRQFPFLTARGSPCAYLDSAATAQKPQSVIDAMRQQEEMHTANVHRGMYPLAEEATAIYEAARQSVQSFLGAQAPQEIIFTKNCTEAVNLVAKSWGKANLRKGDAVVLSPLEHHSAIVPWMQLAEHSEITLAWVNMDASCAYTVESLRTTLDTVQAKLVCITGQSNVVGVRPPLKESIEVAHNAGALVLVDAAQLCVHHPVNVRELGCDFLAFSGHKLYGPTGIGVLYGRRELLEGMSPFLTGGSMIREVTRKGFSSAELPQKFEAGTPPITQAVGLAAAIKWLGQYPWGEIEAHERTLIETTFAGLQSIPRLRILGSDDPGAISGCMSFVVEGVHPHDLTAILGDQGFCLRGGHHCAQPLHEHLGVPASTRISFGMYNTIAEVQAFLPALEKAIHLLSKS